MIACVCPSDNYADENISTLTYATKASYIANDPKRNDDPKMQLIAELKEKIAKLESELKAANEHIEFLTDLAGQSKQPQIQQIEAVPSVIPQPIVKQ